MHTHIVLFAFHNTGYQCLEWLIGHPSIVVRLVISHQPYKGENVWFNSVLNLAREYRIAVLDADIDKAAKITSAVQTAKPDFILSINYRKIISSMLLSVPTRGAYNIHDSLLPAYKGFSPSVWAMLKGETETGVTIHKMVEEVDSGDIVGQCRFPIWECDTLLDVLERVTELSLGLGQMVLPGLMDESATHQRQKPGDGFFMPRRGLKDDYIDWSAGAWHVYCFVRAVNYPVSFSRTHLSNQEIRIGKVSIVDEGLPVDGFRPGKVLAISEDGALSVSCGDNAVQVLEYEPLGHASINIKPGDYFT